MINQDQNLEKAILKTLAFFDIFDYPLTLVEIYRWLYQPGRQYRLFEIFQVLDSEDLSGRINYKNGFYFLAGRQNIIQTRLERYQVAERKFRIALRAAGWIRFIAFVKMIAVCNNAGYSNADDERDIDFFIIVKQGRLWWTRLVVTLLLTVLGLRRHGEKIIDRVCLSFYITDDRLNLEHIALSQEDPYLVYWFGTLTPIYDKGKYQQFMAANAWLKNYLPDFYHYFSTGRRQIKDSGYIKFSKKIDEFILGGFLGDWFEKAVKFIQLSKMKRNTKSAVNQPGNKVIISDSMLKFHETDKRVEYKERWRQKLNRLEIL